MSEECTHDCSNCSAACSSRDAAPQHDAPNPHSRVKKVIGVVSGKGGVGKSMTSALLACAMARRGYHCGILDADITGPSIPRLFGVKGPATGDGESINPVSSRTGVEIMSINPCELVNVVASEPAAKAPCVAPAAPSSLSSSSTLIGMPS